MKEKELREAANCGVCFRPFGHAQLPLFWRITIERYGVDLKAVQRQDGLAAMVGSPLLASIVGPDQDMTKPLMGPVTVTICEDCITKPMLIASLGGLYDE